MNEIVFERKLDANWKGIRELYFNVFIIHLNVSKKCFTHFRLAIDYIE